MAGLRRFLAPEHRGASGFDDVARDGRVLGLERACDSGERASAPDELAERVDLAVRLVPHLRRCPIGVGVGIAGKRELIGAKRAPIVRERLRCFLDEREVGAGDVAVSSHVRLLDEHHLGAERAHHLRPLS